jgi:hypothetical protein
MKTSNSQPKAPKRLPFDAKTKTVSFEIPIEEYEIMEHAIRTFYASTFYRVSDYENSRPVDIHTQAVRLLRSDVADLLERVPTTRLNYNKGHNAETGAKIIPFPKALP